MIYKFIDDKGTFTVDNPQKYSGLYFPLTNSRGSFLSAISPNLSGDIKADNNHFFNIPQSVEDLRSNLLARREFFIKTGKEIIRLSYPLSDKLEAGMLYQKITKQAADLRIEILNFVPHNLDAEVMRIKVINTGKNPITITPTSFIPLFGRCEKNLRDHRHVSSLLNRITLDKYGILLKPTMIFNETGHTVNETIYYCLGFEANSLAPLGQFPTLDCFFGQGDIVFPEAIYKQVNPLTKHNSQIQGKEACAGLRFKTKVLKPGEKSEYSLILGIANNVNKVKETFELLNSSEKISNSISKTKQYWQNYSKTIQIETGNKNKDGWLNWVKLQPVLRKLFGCSFLPHFDYGKGGRGWRDLWQDALALLLTEPQKAKELIISSFRGVRVDGSNATIIANDGSFISDRNKINRVWMDHGVWPYLTLRSYINRTLDSDILLKEIDYFCDHQLKRGKEINRDFCQKDFILRTADSKIYLGTMLEHILIQNLVQFFNVGEHNIIRLEHADWNDSLDMAANKGESVTFSFMYAHNLNDLCGFLEKLKNKTESVSILKELSLLLDTIVSPINYSNYEEKQKLLENYLEQVKNLNGEKVSIKIDDLVNDLRTKYNHLSHWLATKEWMTKGFYNGYYDNKGKRSAQALEKPVKMMLPPQVFSIMSGVASHEQIKDIFSSVKKYLYDPKLKGFRLNTDLKSTYMDLGRAFGFSFGDKENGAVFSHMVVMLANSLYLRGFIKEGREVFTSLFKMATNNKALIYPVLPEYFNSNGKGLYLYLTGSASWFIHTFMEEVLGIKFFLGDMVIEPKLTAQDFTGSSIKTSFTLEAKTLTLYYIRENKKSSLPALYKTEMANRALQVESGKCTIPRKDIFAGVEDVEIKLYLK